MEQPTQTPPKENTRAINAPNVIIGLAALFIGIHAGTGLLSSERYLDVLIRYSFIPARYHFPGSLPGSPISEWISPISHAFLHGNWLHVLTNSVWMLAFGSALAWRFKSVRFLLFSGACAAAGAAMHYLFNSDSLVPTIGASAAISGQMAAVGRFAFSAGGPLSRAARQQGEQAFLHPAEPFSQLLKNSSALIFIGVWFVMNLTFGLSDGGIAGEGSRIAWEAHMGGFLAGLALFPLFDPVPRSG